MEWTRQRFRLGFFLRLDSSGYSNLNNNSKRLFRVTTYTNQSLIVLLAFLSVICLPCVVLSAVEFSGNLPSSINSINYNYKNSDSKIQPHGASIWRSIRQADLLKRDGFSSPVDSISNKNLSSSLRENPPDFGDEETESLTTTHKTKRPILHRKPHPDAVGGPQNSEAILKDEINRLDNLVKHPRPFGYGNEGESQGEDLKKIQSILRDIFLDEFQSEEELEDEDSEGYSLTHSGLSRSSNNDLKNQSQILLSRHIRSEAEPEGRAGSKGKKSKASRVSNTNNSSSNGKGRQKKKSPKGSDLGKYNGYMDSVFRRMNTMIKAKKMDPLRVNLYAGASKAPGKTGSGSGSNGEKNGKGKKKYTPRMDMDSEELEEDQELEDEDEDLEDGPARRDIFLNNSHNSEDNDQDAISTRTIRALLESVNSTSPETSDSPRGTNSDSKSKKSKQSNRDKNSGSKANKGQGGGGGKKPGNSASGANKGSKNNKNNKNKKSRPTRGILHGLSTLKREGNVAVIKQGEQARIVRANFLLGPVSLEIMPKKGKSTDDGKPVAATATASKLKGVLEVRLKKGSPTRIRRLRVYPPKNVKVEGTAQSLQGSKGNKKPQQYGKVTPMATARLRQIASTVVRQADKTNKSP